MTTPALSLVIPAYNEERNLAPVVSAWAALLAQLVPDHEILILDDGSTDRTLDAARTLAATHPRLRVLTGPNRGHGPAVLTGYAQAAGDWIMQIDADEILGLAEFPDMWAARDSYVFQIGIRVNRNSSPLRRLLSLSAGLATRLLLGGAPDDANCPCRLMSRAFLSRALACIPPDAFAPNVIISGLACRQHLPLRQLPVTYQGARNRTSSIRLARLPRIALAAAGGLLRAAWRVRQGQGR